MNEDGLVEVIAQLVHGVYLREARRQKDEQFPEEYKNLTDSTKQYHRAIALFIVKCVEEAEKR